MNAEQKENLRHAALEVLASRHPAAWSAIAISRELKKLLGDTPPDDELKSALAFLVDARLLTIVRDELGSTTYFAATKDGVLAVERG